MFAQLVRNYMEGPVLRYSHRARLIRQAENRGIGRFEANLIIAAVQHEVREGRAADTAAGASWKWRTGVIVFVATQAAIAIGWWWLLIR
jgi:hypothetical protein